MEIQLIKSRAFFALLFACLLFMPAAASASVMLAEPNLNTLANGLVGYWTFDGNATNWSTGITNDLSGNGNSGQMVGMSTTTSPVVGKIGQALTFNGTNSYILTANPVTTGIVAATISAWIYVTSDDSGKVITAATTQPENNAAQGMAINYNQATSGSYQADDSFSFWINTGGTWQAVLAPGPLITGQWYHVVGTYDGATQAIYINGILSAQRAQRGIVSQPTGAATLGAFTFNSSYMNGRLDDVRIYNRALSAQEVALLYAAGTFSLGNTPTANSAISIDQTGLSGGLVGYWTFDGNATNWSTGITNDLSGNGNSGQMVGMSTTTSPVAGKIGQALQFTSGGYVNVPANANYQGTSGTWSAWFKIAANPGGNGAALMEEANSGGSFDGIYIAMAANGTLAAAAKNGGGFLFNLNPSNVYSDGKWHQFALTFNGTVNATLYIDGVALVTATPSGTIPFGSNPFRLGTVSDSYFGTFLGALDDVRIYNRALSAQEVAQLYAAGEVNIAHSNTTSGTGLNSGLVGYWTFDGPTLNWATGIATDMSASGNNGQLEGMSTTTSPVIGKIGQALQFNGTNQYVSLGSNATLHPEGSSFTVSLWFRATALANSPLVVDSAVAAKGFNLVINRTASFCGGVGGNNVDLTKAGLADQCVAYTFNTGQWYHIVAVQNYAAGAPSNVQYFVNGVPIGSFTNTTNFNSAVGQTAQLALSTDLSTYYSGAEDDVRIYNRALSAQEVEQLYLMGK